MKHLIILLFSLLITQTAVCAESTYLEPAEFVNNSFTGEIPSPNVIWIKKDLKKQIEDILAHKYKSLRVRYWKKDQRSVWVLDEIGKTKPITTGIVIDKNKISEIKVLIFRESRGWEVRHPFFTKQFIDIKLNKENQLTEKIDGISGATLSVRALTKLARVALLLNQHITNQNDS